METILNYKKLLSTFPDLYNYGIFSPFILRMAVALIFLKMGKEDFSRLNGVTLFNYISGLLKIIIGLMLMFAFYTQPASILATIISLSKIVSTPRDTENKKYAFAYYFLVALVSFSLLFSGPGAFSFDLPL